MSLSPLALYRDFRVQCYDLTLRALQPIALPPFLGSTMHGGLGVALKQIGCFLPGAHACPPCRHPAQCPYNLLFEYKNLPLDHIPKRYHESPPKLYLLELPSPSPSRLQVGDRLSFRLTLFGSAIDMRIYFILAMRVWSENGLGFQRGRFEIERIVAANPLTHAQQEIYSSHQQMVQQNEEPLTVGEISRWCESWNAGNVLKLTFASPARLFGRGYGPNDLELKVVLKAALERLSILALLSGLPQGETDWHTPLAAAEKISVLARAIAMQDLSRYSKRQEQHMSYGGFLGHILLQGDFTELKPYLKLAELLHVGKNPTFGLGQVRFESM